MYVALTSSMGNNLKNLNQCEDAFEGNIQGYLC